MYYSVLILLCDREGWSCSFTPPSCCFLLSPSSYPHPREGEGAQRHSKGLSCLLSSSSSSIIGGAGAGTHSLCTLDNCSTNEYCLWPCFILLMELYLKQDGVDSRKRVMRVTMVITALLCGECWLKHLSCMILHAISTAV